jgi:rRNA-processing protein FCF1
MSPRACMAVRLATSEARRPSALKALPFDLRMRAYVPDTNVWLHATLPIDFASLAPGEDFFVVVPQRVLSELDRKDHEGRGATRKRARQMTMEFRSMMQTGTTGNGVIEALGSDGTIYRFVVDATAPAGASADDVIVVTARIPSADGLEGLVRASMRCHRSHESKIGMYRHVRIARGVVAFLAPD